MADKTILIGTALDEGSDATVRTGFAWARAMGARAYVAYAFTPPMMVMGELGMTPYLNELGPSPASDEYLVAEEQQLRDALAQQTEQAAGDPAEIAGWAMRPGAPHRVLADLAAELDADMVVISATAPGAFPRLLGSVADRVVRKATCPVLVLRGEPRVPPARVLAPLDLSPLSAEAFRAGLGRLGALREASPEVEALFVLNVMQRQVAPQFSPEQVDRFAGEELDRFVAKHAGPGAASIRRKVRAGGTREQVLAEIADFGADLVLIGTHGLSGFDRYVIGSVAADVVREAPCSVLVVPPVERAES
jgi:nucleotide-binding universal stress UspA family protein